jgi:nicotinamidase-related amidase
MSTTIKPDFSYSKKFEGLEYNTPELLNPTNHTLILIDHEGQMAFSVESISKIELRNNVGTLSYFARAFDIPLILTTIGERMFAGPLFPEIREFHPDAKSYDRTSQNAWEDRAAREAIIATDKKKLVMAGLWTDVCLAFPAISALNAGYDVYFVADASGANSVAAHELAVQRMIQAGAKPLGTTAYISEIVRDWGRADMIDPEFSALIHQGIIRFSNMGLGLDYADYMVPAYPAYKGFGQ